VKERKKDMFLLTEIREHDEPAVQAGYLKSGAIFSLLSLTVLPR